MSAVPSTIEQPAVAEPRQPRGGAAQLLVLGCYVLAAVAITGRLWLDPAGRMQLGDRQDVNLFACLLSPVPAGWQAAFTRLRLPPDARVLVVPVPLVSRTTPMRWQADTGEPASMIGGYFSAPDSVGEPLFTIGPTEPAADYLNRLALTPKRPDLASAEVVRSALRFWRPAAVVAVTRPGSRLARFLTSLLGPAAFHVGKVLVWRQPPPRAT